MNSQLSQSPNPSGPAACHAHSLTAARCWLHLPKSEIIWKIYTQGLHTPKTQMYTIPTMMEVLSGKHQWQSVPTLSSTRAHCHANSLTAVCSRLPVPTSVIIWKMYAQGLHMPKTQTYMIPITTEVFLGKHQSVNSHTVKHVGPLPRPHRSNAHHRSQCATMLSQRFPRDYNNFPGFRHHVGDVN